MGRLTIALNIALLVLAAWLGLAEYKRHERHAEEASANTDVVWVDEG